MANFVDKFIKGNNLENKTNTSKEFKTTKDSCFLINGKVVKPNESKGNDKVKAEGGYFIIDGRVVKGENTVVIEKSVQNKVNSYYLIDGRTIKANSYAEAREIVYGKQENKNSKQVKNESNSKPVTLSTTISSRNKGSSSVLLSSYTKEAKKEDVKPHLVMSMGTKKVEVEKKETPKVKNGMTIKERIEQIKKDIALNKEKMQLIDNWKSIMANCGQYNSSYDSFEIVHETKTGYGWWFRVYAPDGLALKDLETVKPKIESNIGCIFMYEIASSNKYATCRIIYEDQVKCNEIPFEPVKVKPYEVYPGLRVTGEPLVIDSIASPHVLLAGGTRRGKNGAADSILLSWLNSCTEKELELYLFQCAKVDLIKYKDCKQVKCCVVGEFKEMLEIIEHLVENEIKRRLKLFEPMFKQRKGENIFDYNKLNPHKKLPYCWLIFDEFLELMLQSKSKKEENEIKNAILDHIERIGQMGAAVGIQYMIIHQKPEKALCPTFIKNMSNIRICFGFEDESCGRIVLGDRDGHLVVNLPPRRAYVNNNGAMELMFTTDLKDRRDKYIRPHEVNNKRDILDEIQHSRELTQKPDEKQIKKVRSGNDSTAVKQDAGTATLPSGNKHNITKGKVVSIAKSLNIPKDITDIKIDTANVDNNKQNENRNKTKENIIDTDKIKDKTNDINIFRHQEELDNKVEFVELSTEKEKDTTKNNETVFKQFEEVKEEVYVEVNDVESKKKDTVENQSNKVKSNSGLRIAVGIENIDIDKIIEENIKNIPGWVPYEPKEGDKVPDARDIARLSIRANK